MQAGKKILKNMLSLSAAELASKGIVFLWTAILARELGKSGMGMIGFANTYVNYFILFITLGFNTVGAREIAKFSEKINKYVNTIVTMRLILAAAGYAVLAVTVAFMDKSDEAKIIILICGGSLFANAILLDWVYQGVEKMEILALRQVIVNVLNLTGIIIFVNGREDAVLAMAIITLALVINSLWMLAVYIKIYGALKLKLNIELMKELRKSALPLAVSTLFITLLNTFNILILGFIKGDAATGIYFVAFKVLVLSLLPSNVIQYAFFPVLSRAGTLEEKRKIVSKFTLLLAVAGVFTSAVFFTYADFIITKVFSAEFSESVDIVRILMASSFFAYINISLNIPLITWKKEKQSMLAIIAGCTLNIVLNFALIPEYSYYGAAVAALASEIAVGAGLAYFFYKNIKLLYLWNFAKLLLISGFSCAAGYFAATLNLNTFAAIAISFIIFAGTVFSLKIIDIEDLKKYLFNKNK